MGYHRLPRFADYWSSIACR